VRDLAQEYEGEVRFTLISAEETATSGEALDAFGFTEARHGLVAFTADGEALVKMPGHNFGREEIVGAIREVLAAN
jgi:hypothetical protein